MPFSAPPAPSEPPKSRILTPLTGIANKPLAEAKAMAGLVRAGAFRAPKLGLPLALDGWPRPRGDRGGARGWVAPDLAPVDRQPIALGGDGLAQRHQLGEVAGQLF